MTQLVLSLGSNIERHKNILYAVQQLRRVYGTVTLSPVYETVAVGFDGPDFYNLVVMMQTEMNLDTILHDIQLIEAGAGRIRGDKGFDNRVLDIDVLLYGDADLRAEGKNIPRDEIYHAAYVLKPLADILPETAHPVTQCDFRTMWGDFQHDVQTLQAVEFEFDV